MAHRATGGRQSLAAQCVLGPARTSSGAGLGAAATFFTTTPPTPGHLGWGQKGKKKKEQNKKTK